MTTYVGFILFFKIFLLFYYSNKVIQKYKNLLVLPKLLFHKLKDKGVLCITLLKIGHYLNNIMI